MALQLINRSLRITKYYPLFVIKRNTTNDQNTSMIGNREVVGYGWNGSPCYADRTDYPFPSMRFMEPTKEICDLRDKELADWKKLSISDKKKLYRYSFCQTFAEMKAPTADWKMNLAAGFWASAIGLLLSYTYYLFLYDEYPESFSEERRRAQLKRMLDLHVNPIEGISSKWDYENNCWK